MSKLDQERVAGILTIKQYIQLLFYPGMYCNAKSGDLENFLAKKYIEERDFINNVEYIINNSDGKIDISTASEALYNSKNKINLAFIYMILKSENFDFNKLEGKLSIEDLLTQIEEIFVSGINEIPNSSKILEHANFILNYYKNSTLYINI